jgi:hypothetical protein
MRTLRWIPALLALLAALLLFSPIALPDAPPELAFAGLAIGMVAKRETEKEHQDMTDAEKEEENRRYVESQEPIVREPEVLLNEPGQHVPAPAPQKEPRK